MRFTNLWQQARANVLRRRYEEMMQQIDAADPVVKSAYVGVIKSSFEILSNRYAGGSIAERKEILKHALRTIHQLSNERDWPRGLGLAIIMFNLEARLLPGNDAAVLRDATNRLLEEAVVHSEAQLLKKAS